MIILGAANNGPVGESVSIPMPNGQIVPILLFFFQKTYKNIGFQAMLRQKRPKTGLFCLSEKLSNLSGIIFSGQTSDGNIHTDQGKT